MCVGEDAEPAVHGAVIELKEALWLAIPIPARSVAASKTTGKRH
jgi:hypothetical protein